MKKLGRRSFLETLVVSAGAASLGPSLLGCGSRPSAEVFPQSVASGDPRPDSIVLWTRALPDDLALATEVSLELATDEAFSSRLDLGARASLVAEADNDHCLRVKVTGLEAGTTYYYRFAANGATSHPGRFRTAPAADADAPVRFAVLSCQDYVGRYYNTLLRLLDAGHDDLDFVVHLGDYVYETTGDPGFMMEGGARSVTFRQPEQAIARGEGEDAYYAARSVDNYRDLYRTYRSDELLQRLHERFAFLCIWDDHEFSDDCYQASGTYTDGVLDETDVPRRASAERAWLEYMPVARDAEAEGALDSTSGLFPDNRIFRDFRFGRHLTLALTDSRSYRADHATPEDAYPGSILLTEAQVRAALAQQVADGELEVDADMAFEMGGFRRYVDPNDLPEHQTALQQVLLAAYTATGMEGARAEALAGVASSNPVDAAILLATLEEAGITGLPALDPTDAALPRGLPYALLGKSTLVGQLGARYLTLERTSKLADVHRYRVSGDAAGAIDAVLGAAQATWLRETLSGSDATWNVVGGSVCNTSLVLDLRPFAGGLPEALPAERFFLNVDHWDGFPEARRALIRDVYGPANAVLIAGDIHACFATDFGPDADGNRVIELTTPGVSSGSWKELLFRTGNAVESIRESGLLGPVLESLDIFQQEAFPPLKVSRSDRNGVMVVRVDGTALTSDWHLLPEDVVGERYYDRAAELDARWERVTQRVEKQAGKNGPLPGLEE